MSRFATHFAKGHHGRGKGGRLNFETLRHGLYYINKACIFRYESYTLGAHGASRLQETVKALYQEGELTKEMTRSREPAGAIVVRRLVRELLHDGITKGTSSWDSLINDVAILILVSAFSCRGGDILGDSALTKDKPQDLPGLRYQDFELHVGAGGTITAITAKITIRNAKNMRGDAKKYYSIMRNTLPEGKNNTMCVAKWILILGLRSDNTYGSTIEDVLSQAIQRHHSKIQWRFPTRPILCGSPADPGDQVMSWEILADRLRGYRAINRAARLGAADDIQAIAPGNPSRIHELIN